MIRKYCPKQWGHGVTNCYACQFYMDDCDGDENEIPNIERGRIN